MAMLDTMASMVHLKMKYYNSSGESIVSPADLHGALRIYETILENPSMIFVTSMRRKKNVCEAIGVVSFDI